MEEVSEVQISTWIYQFTVYVVD